MVFLDNCSPQLLIAANPTPTLAAITGAGAVTKKVMAMLMLMLMATVLVMVIVKAMVITKTEGTELKLL